MGAVALLATSSPGEALLPVAVGALCVSAASATQDIVIDAYRVEILEPARYGAGSAVAIWGWHLGGTLVGGAGGLYLADAFGWQAAYGALALAVLVGVVAVLLAPEPPRRVDADAAAAEAAGRALAGRLHGRSAALLRWLHGAVVAPLVEFARRPGWWVILVFVFVFKLGDALLGRMAGVFYRELGFGLDEIAAVAKVYGLTANAVGILVGGWMVARLGTLRALLAGGLAAAATNVVYAVLASAGKDSATFVAAVVADNFTGGLATVAFVAYLSGLCNLAFTATQYALLASLGNLARIWFSASAGAAVDALDGDWATFFLGTAVVALAGLPLLAVIMRRYPESARTAPPESAPEPP
jgi:PAT family beta-lactamase induction signal transducer AmpG